MNSILIRKPFFLSNSLILGLALIFLVGACLLNFQNKKPAIVVSKQDTAININTKFLMLLSGGHKRLLTDLLWIQTLLESDTEHYQQKDLNNWLFLRFNTISILDPKFYENYAFGGQFLNVIKDDLEGAKIIYDRGLNQYPDDYVLNLQAGFMYYFELGDFEAGLKYLSRVEENPRAPLYIKSITNKLRFHIDGDLEKVFELVEINYQTTKNEMLKERLKNDLYRIRAEIDLNCLNSGKKNCHHEDLDGKDYILQNGLYKTVKPFSPFRIRTRKDKQPQ